MAYRKWVWTGLLALLCLAVPACQKQLDEDVAIDQAGAADTAVPDALELGPGRDLGDQASPAPDSDFETESELPWICTPRCEGRQCGQDHCGGTCGNCPSEMECNDGTCQIPCVADCVGKEGGEDDGCGHPCVQVGPGGACWPCVEQSDCLPDYQCVGYPSASMCRLQANAPADCPDGFGYDDDTHTCYSNAPCLCSAQAVAAGAKAACARVNQYGTCAGFEACEQVGKPMTWCDAPEALPELCNGLDDDCDGQVDEECGGCFDPVCADVLCTTNCDDPHCLIKCCDGSCQICEEADPKAAPPQAPQPDVPSPSSKCRPSCEGKSCGLDGCGGTCGQCAWATMCYNGTCICIFR